MSLVDLRPADTDHLTWIETAIIWLSRFIPIQTPRSMREPALYESDVEKRAGVIYEQFYSKYSDFHGARVVELGGTGAAARYYLSKGPRKYYVANTVVDEAKALALSRWVDQGVVEYVTTSANSIPLAGDSVDIVISENTFEHLVDYRAMIEECRRILRPGGILVAQFSPLYFSPYGAHLYEVIKLPWLTLICHDTSVERMLRVELKNIGFSEHFEHNWQQYLSLNRLRPSDFCAPFQKSDDWCDASFDSFPFGWSLRSPEPICSLLTHGLKIAATKV